MRWTAGFVALSLTAAATASAQQPMPGGFHGTIGVASAALPRYLGSDEHRVLPLPLVSLERGRLFLSTTSGLGAAMGAHVVRTKSLQFDVMVGGSDSRPEDRGDALAGMGDRDFGSNVGASMTVRQGMFQTTVDVRQGLNEDAGFTGMLSAGMTRRFGRFITSVTGSATLYDEKQMQYEFGINAAQAATRDELIAEGDPRIDPTEAGIYAPQGGVASLGVKSSIGYMVSTRWTVLGFTSVDRLRGDAADSPLVQDRNSVIAGLGVSFRW